MMKILYHRFVFSFLLLPALLFGQNIEDKSLLLTGQLHTDSKIIINNYKQQQTVFSDELPGKKNPVLSGILSAVIPGAGQFYNEDYWIAGIFLAAEAALIYVGLTYDKKGDDQTASFEKYADENWSVVDYATWLNTYEGANIAIDPDENKQPWERVNWSELNAAETGSHNLPPHGEQQYYELIGKYHQYSPGWNDFTGGANKELVSPNLLYYSGERGKANDYYSTAKTAVIGIYINHLLSALEAVWGATRFNNDIALNVRVKSINVANRIEFIPTLNFRYSF
jgi:hypothetical protein